MVSDHMASDDIQAAREVNFDLGTIRKRYFSAPGTTPTLRGGQSASALPQRSDVNLFGYGESVIDLDA